MRSAALLLVAAAAPAAGAPTMALSKKKCPAAAHAAHVTADAYNIAVTVAGAKGYAYSCNAAYDPAAQTTDKQCADWAADGTEDLTITLDITQGGKREHCMLWQLTFGAAEEGGWWPADAIDMADPVRSARDFFAAHAQRARVAAPRNVPGYDNNTGNPDCVHDPKCNSPAIRDTVARAYLDSMTYVSHACVPAKVNDIVYGLGGADNAFPPGVSTPALFRVAHKALAISSVIHSIDRTCKEAWKIGKSESCVSFPELHCHTHCDMTWNLGPGGIAHWGMQFLNHHIPSPGINIAQQLKKDATDKAYGDLGCGN